MMTPGPSGPHAYLAGQLASVLQPWVGRSGLFLLTESNTGTPEDFRVPDLSVRRGSLDGAYFDTAELVVEVASPGDESWQKFDFYAAHDVDEILIADPQIQVLHWFALVEGAYAPVERSAVLEVTVAEVHDAIDWEPLRGRR